MQYLQVDEGHIGKRSVEEVQRASDKERGENSTISG